MNISKEERASVAKTEEIIGAIKDKLSIGTGAKKGVDLVALTKNLAQRRIQKQK